MASLAHLVAFDGQSVAQRAYLVLQTVIDAFVFGDAPCDLPLLDLGKRLGSVGLKIAKRAPEFAQLRSIPDNLHHVVAELRV